MQQFYQPNSLQTGQFPSESVNNYERERDNTRQDKIILLSGLRPITTGVNIQAIRILMDPMTDLGA